MYSLRQILVFLAAFSHQQNNVEAMGVFPPDSLPDGISYDISIDPSDGSRMKFVVEVPKNMYFALSFGNGMINSDMVGFFAAPGFPNI